MQCKWTSTKRFNLATAQAKPHVTATVPKKCASLAAVSFSLMLLFTQYKLPGSPRGVVGRERVGTAFPHLFTFSCKMSLKLFQSGYFSGCVPTPFLLAPHPWAYHCQQSHAVKRLLPQLEVYL